jgi:hypothetical protein
VHEALAPVVVAFQRTLPGVGIGQVANCVYTPVTWAPRSHPLVTTPCSVAVTGTTPSFSVMCMSAMKVCLKPWNS